MAELELAPGMMGAPNIQLVRKLRDGGMGSVWVAEHQALKTFVAVKFMHLDVGKKKDASSRFSREASAAAQIKSPHVVQVFDHGTNTHGMAFIVMELLDGEDLGTRLATRKALPLIDVATIVSQSAKALGKAHANGIIHRDIKPDNIFLTDVEGDIFVKVLDFGIAKQEDDVSMTMTSTGVMMGTPNYMAPEQMTNAKDAVAGSDLWSLAIVAYQALTGVLPFNGETVAGIAIAIERGKFPPPSTLVAGLPAVVDAWFLRAFKREPKDRFGSAREMADELMIIVNPNARRPMQSELGATSAGVVSPLPDSGGAAAARPPTQMGATLDGTVPMRKRGVAVWAVGAALVLGVGGAAYFFLREPSKSALGAAAQATGEASSAAAVPSSVTSHSAEAHSAEPDASSAPVTDSAKPASSAAPSSAAPSSAAPSSAAPSSAAPSSAAPSSGASTSATPTTGQSPHPYVKPTGKWPPPKGPTVKDRGF